MEETKKVDDGGPAFPQTHKLMNKGFPDMVVPETTGGLSIRDYFAAKAMASLYANASILELADSVAGIGEKTTREVVAAKAFEIADEMLKARSARTTPAGDRDE